VHGHFAKSTGDALDASMIHFIRKTAGWHAGALRRAERRKSIWNVFLLLFGFAAWLAIGYGLFRFVWMVHVALYPSHQLGDFWRGNISPRSFVCSFLMLFAPVPGAIVLGLMLANFLFWLIPSARRTLDSEARNYPGTGFRESMRGLSRVGFFVLLPGIVIALAAAFLLKSLH
jgi:hypothetical protein